MKGDQAAIDNAQTNLGYTSIKAPISGRTGFRLVDPGNIVHAADTTGIVTIAQLQPIAVQFTEPEEQLQAIDKAFDAGEVPVEALTSDGTRTLSQGRLVVMDNSVNQATGTISLKARFDNKDNALWPGLSVTTRMLIDTLQAGRRRAAGWRAARAVGSVRLCDRRQWQGQREADQGQSERRRECRGLRRPERRRQDRRGRAVAPVRWRAGRRQAAGSADGGCERHATQVKDRIG